MSLRIRVVLQVRMSSGRLPAKALLPVAGIPMCVLAAHRASRAGLDLVVATSQERSDDLLARIVTASGHRVARGPLNDVLQRFTVATADLRPDDLCVRLTADNIFPDSDLVHTLIDAMASEPVEYMSFAGLTQGRAPMGVSAEAFTIRALREANRSARDPHQREHVTPLIRERHEFAQSHPHLLRGELGGLRCTVDTLADYAQVAGFMATCSDPVGTSWDVLMYGFHQYVTEAVVSEPEIFGI